jgi:hypothetical protein
MIGNRLVYGQAIAISCMTERRESTRRTHNDSAKQTSNSDPLFYSLEFLAGGAEQVLNMGWSEEVQKFVYLCSIIDE